MEDENAALRAQCDREAADCAEIERQLKEVKLEKETLARLRVNYFPGTPGLPQGNAGPPPGPGNYVGPGSPGNAGFPPGSGNYAGPGSPGNNAGPVSGFGGPHAVPPPSRSPMGSPMTQAAGGPAR